MAALRFSGIEIKTDAELALLSPRQVYSAFAICRARHSSMMGSGFDECEPPCDEEFAEMDQLEQYMERLKAELKRRPYAKLTKVRRIAARKVKLADLRGNRRPRREVLKPKR